MRNLKLSHLYYLGSSLFLYVLLFVPFLSYSAETSNMRGKRYCEIILTKTISSYAVYNTWGLNNCPEQLWSKVSISAVKKETGSSFVHLNGPRYWVIDGFKNTSLINPAIKTISGIPMREAGILHLSLMDLFKNKPYQSHVVDRKTTWVYQADKPVFELIDPNGQVFVMQSYSVQKYPQTMNTLTQLGAKLQLPKGWKFKTGVLNKPETIQAVNNKAVVVQDNFLNTYQKASHDFLK
ncbi:hypothetical protein [Legionella pneumophila]|uniref:hypothetical protein n=1 Tax=Legionella pneumophila TaxID=446 RepID=UPI000770A9A9|nr:hypothetical protein [Legionella pneumophila]CZG25903.1 Uncharacterised protein [Legionella pneumophila]HAT1980406.1 hypothetical protein [Legionella pneumophila]HAT4422728.1 hypothetical protein [Legionella pneumophila]HAU1719470.1 hypothetical protein [Legionella pneumophila]